MKSLTIKQLFYLFITGGVVLIFAYVFFSSAELKSSLIAEKDALMLKTVYKTTEKIAFVYNNATLNFNNNIAILQEALQEAESLTLNQGVNVSLRELKIKYERQHTDFRFDFFLINDNYVVFNTTKPSDLNLDFKKLPTAFADVKNTYQKPQHIDYSPIVNDALTNEFIKYALKKVRNKNYLLQVAITMRNSSTRPIIQKSLSTVTNLLSYNLIYLFEVNTLFDENLTKAPYEIQLHWNDKVYNANKQKAIEQHSKYGQQAIEELLITNNISPKYSDIVKYFESKPYLYHSKRSDDKYIYTIALPFQNILYSNNPKKTTLLLLQFDDTAKYKSIKKFNLILLFVWIVVILIVIFAIFILYTRFLRPIESLESNMIKKEPIKSIDIFNNNDEITNIMRLYNQLLLDLKREINTNEELLKQFKTFTGDSIHQIRTPLSVIKIALEMLDTKNDEQLLIIKSSVLTLEHMYDSLSYSLQQEDVSFEKENINLSQLLHERIEMFSTIALANDKKIIAEIENNIMIFMNQTEAEFLIDNNLSNAIKYGKINKPIHVRLQKTTNNNILAFETFSKKIQDTEAIFVRYNREDKAKNGSGIGLHMVKSICDKSNIIIDIDYVDYKNCFIYYFEVM